jgi:NADPH:quinone reductase-like Zn-dependent oxidoreductase
MQQDASVPRPGRAELLIQVCAAGVILTELSWYPTSHRKTGEARVGAVPGHEFSGVVAAVGEQVGSLEIGQDVYGMNDWYSDGAIAEYCIAPFFAIAPKPHSLTHAEAASVPISALTAWQGLFERAKLQPGERVLVHGGAGAVGIFVIQLAKLHGAGNCNLVGTKQRLCNQLGRQSGDRLSGIAIRSMRQGPGCRIRHRRRRNAGAILERSQTWRAYGNRSF